MITIDDTIARYRAFKQPLKDANSGFEPRYFDEGTYQRWKPLLDETYAPWRFALDEMRELADVERIGAFHNYLAGHDNNEHDVTPIVTNI